jgi:hypothetical protein
LQPEWVDEACKAAPATILGQSFPSPTRCVDKGLLGEWGEWVVNDASCAARWSEFQDKGCSAPTVRTFASRLRDVPAGQTWEAA